jgi:hypothetical protein
MEQARSPSRSKSPLTTDRKKTTIEQEDDNSIVEEVIDDWSSDNSLDTSPATVHPKKRPTKKASSPPPTVTTPQRAAQRPRVTGTPPHMVRPQESSSPRTTIRESLGHFLAEQVHTLCLHPYSKSKDACYTKDDVPYNKSKDSCYTVDLTNDATKTHGSKAVP